MDKYIADIIILSGRSSTEFTNQPRTSANYYVRVIYLSVYGSSRSSMNRGNLNEASLLTLRFIKYMKASLILMGDSISPVSVGIGDRPK